MTTSIAAGGVQRALFAHHRLQRAAGEVLHRDVVRAVPLPAVEDRDHVGVREARGGGGLAAEALHELLVFGEAVVQQLDRHLAAQ